MCDGARRNALPNRRTTSPEAELQAVREVSAPERQRLFFIIRLLGHDAPRGFRENHFTCFAQRVLPQDVARVVFVSTQVTTGGARFRSHATFRDLRLELRDGRSLILPLGRRRDAESVALRAGRTLQLAVHRETVRGGGP